MHTQRNGGRSLKRQPPLVQGAVEEAEVGFEPTNNGFAIRPLGPLGYSAEGALSSLVTGDSSNARKKKPRMSQRSAIGEDNAIS